MKKSLIINDIGSEQWIGGVYYTNNIAFVLSQNEAIVKEYNLILLNNMGECKIFMNLPSSIKVLSCTSKKAFLRNLFKLYVMLRHNVAFIYPSSKSNLLFCKTVSWIPDFQHHYLPEFFSKAELEARNSEYIKISKANSPLVLSSISALNDFRRFYSVKKDNVFVVPFVSYIVPEINSITVEIEEAVLIKFGIKDKPYACIMNQFWQHKNHKLVLEAIELFANSHEDKEFYFVFTGRLSDYRNHEYITSIKNMLERVKIQARCILLGFIDRIEQLVIMKNSEFVIQPSLFEGWGTVVEDAKVLDKTILLSDIPVHREQMNEKCILFDPHNPKELADLIAQEAIIEHHDDISKGIADMYIRAKEYSKGFQRLLGCKD